MAVSIADQFEILPTIPRRTGRQINRAGHPADNPSQFWQRSMYYPFLDYYITELTARLLENGGRYQARYLIPMNLPTLTPDTIDVIFDTYKTDLRCDIVMFKAKIKRWATLTTLNHRIWRTPLRHNRRALSFDQHRFVDTLHHDCQHSYDGEIILCSPSP
jgi:hypothetical protein